VEWKSKLKKDPGIPNLFPYKDKLLHEIEEGKRRKEEDAVKRREEAKARRQAVTSAGGDVAMEGADEEEDGELIDFDEEEDDEDDTAMDVGVSGFLQCSTQGGLLTFIRTRVIQWPLY